MGYPFTLYFFYVFDVSDNALIVFLQDMADMLVWLKKNVVATEPLLRVCAHHSPPLFYLRTTDTSNSQETKAGLAVGKLRTHSNKTVSDLAKELVKKWKGEVDSAKSKTSSTAGSNKTSEGGTPQPRPTGNLFSNTAISNIHASNFS